MPRVCPNCSHTMLPEVFHGLILDVCPNCAGIWFDSGELRKLLTIDPLALIELEEEAVPTCEQCARGGSRLLCPDDNVRLDEYHYLYHSPVVLHTCSKCSGFWVADGDLLKMRQWLDQEHKAPTAKQQAAIGVGLLAGEAEGVEEKQRRISGFFNALRRNVPGWLPFYI